MKYSFSRICLVCLLMMILFGVTYISWSLIRASTSYRTGNYPSATAAWQQLSSLFPGSAGITFNSGVTLYRQREYRKASGLFTRASAEGDPFLKAAAEYNLGNCLVRQGDDLVARDKVGCQARDKAARAAELYRQAIVRYEQAVQLDGADLDAKYNLASARKRLLIVSGTLKDLPVQKPSPGARQQERGRPENGQAQGKQAQGNHEASEAKGTSTDEQARARTSAKPTSDGLKVRSATQPLRMSRKDAEALLQEHLRTGGATALFRDANKAGQPADVLKDW